MNVLDLLGATMVVIVMNDFDQIVENFFKNYHDRGMKKWAGFYLSDHTQTIEKDTKMRGEVVMKRPEQPLEEISVILLDAFSNHREVDVQLKILDEDGQLPKSVVSFVAGYEQEAVVIAAEQIALDDISSVLISD